MKDELYCPYCSTLLTKKKYCDGCREDMTLYKRAVASSWGYYNSGLAKAKVRDLSGAVADLKKSLELYKNNIQARNLLGLVYYEMGEIVEALSEWVISKNYMPDKNELADYYMKDLQDNPTKLENYNQAIKKYNSALVSANQDSEDLAIIQLKKVVALSPNFLKAMHLLALLYIKTGEKERAHRILIKASKIDVANTTTLRYLAHLGYKNDGPDTVAVSYTNNEPQAQSFNPNDLYKEDKPNVIAFVNLIIGIVVGLAVAACLIVPSVKQEAAKRYTVNNTEYSDLISEKDSKINALTTDIESLQGQLDEANKKLGEIDSQNQNAQNIAVTYESILTAVEHYVNGDYEKAAVSLKKVDVKAFEDETPKKIYNSLKPMIVEELYNKGHGLYTNHKYEEALNIFKKIYAIDKKNPDATYFMARSYDQTGDKENAKKYYQYIIDKFPEDKRASEATQKLNSL